MNKEPRIAIIYDRINTFGGAERVLQVLHELYPDSTLFTSVCDKKKTGWTKNWRIKTSFLQRIYLARNHHEWFGWLMPLVFESLDLTDFDIIISITSEAAKAVLTKPNQLHVCYCLTPTRYLWSHTHLYEGNFAVPLKRFVFSVLRQVDFTTAQRPDIYVAISNLVAQRVRKYYKRDVDAVIYPPLTLLHKERTYKKLNGEYFLIVSRLVRYKQIEIAIKAAIQAKEHLVIIGIGNDYERLVKLSENNGLIEFVGSLTDEQLIEYYQHSKALICPQEEDFGIVAIEARSFNIPVITHSPSGVTESGQYYSYRNRNIEDLARLMKNFTHTQPLGNKQESDRYTDTFFKKKFDLLIKKHWNNKYSQMKGIQV